TDITIVASLIDKDNRKWKDELIRTTFEAVDADSILYIPLARKAHVDMIIWCEEHSSEFTVRSAYKLLQAQTTNTCPTDIQIIATTFYKQLWELQIP
ncbi:hypothetical protein ES319_A10G120800v1, partial [Gossypium barbadense]